MQFSSRPTTHNQIVHLRLAGIKLDLGISGEQDSAWEVFVKTFKTVVRALKDVEDEVALHFIEGPPSFAKNLELEVRSLSAQVEAMGTLKDASSYLYFSLAPRQREGADRLLPILCGQLVLMSRSACASERTRTCSLAAGRPSDRKSSPLAA